jgi:hypothetical protein
MPDFEDFGREISKIWPKKLFRTALRGLGSFAFLIEQ